MDRIATSLAAVGRAKPEERAQVLAQLKETNRALQTQKTRTTVSTKSAPVKENKKKHKKSLALPGRKIP